MIARNAQDPSSYALSPRASGGGYAFDNAGAQTGARFVAGTTVFDPGTRRHLSNLGVASGWHCLEVGAGGGSVVEWLCDRVGPTGRVVATDIDTRFLERLGRKNLQVRRHDIVSDPLPQAAFDLVHTRLVLNHLPDRDAVLGRLVTALKPGGWILAEEFDSLSMRADPLVNPAETALNAQLAMQRTLAVRGVEMRYGRLLAGRFRRNGLTDVGAEGRVFMWQGRSDGAQFLCSSLEQLRGEMIESGYITDGELEQDLARLASENYQAPSPILWAAWGRRRRPPGET